MEREVPLTVHDKSWWLKSLSVAVEERHCLCLVRAHHGMGLTFDSGEHLVIDEQETRDLSITRLYMTELVPSNYAFRIQHS